jgi:hypothetical protein
MADAPQTDAFAECDKADAPGYEDWGAVEIRGGQEYGKGQREWNNRTAAEEPSTDGGHYSRI